MEIIVRDYTKRIKNTYILNKISLEFMGGNIYGITGQNGSGKTMLLRAISGLIHPTEGKVFINGKELFKEVDFPMNTGIVIEKPEFLGYLSGLENLTLLSKVNNKISLLQIKEYLRLFNLNPDSKLHMKSYSLGMKQKIGIIQAIMENPDILILDEPFNALDQESVELLRNILLKFKNQGKLIIVTSHHKDDIEAICSRVIHLEDGKIVS
ncbi:ATP-binding cassette domain-containing protein [Dysosmobacter welbionis]|uniref:ABC transporter ATP-binding protein n=1 Tax=Dysosmobacter welbionis TaxID=2093857 RepID=UPI0029426B47|nr:ATP-binding cassette domain-containing protein [Dysosmobacter welbionis]